jgi:hypothetical protein
MNIRHAPNLRKASRWTQLLLYSKTYLNQTSLGLAYLYLFADKEVQNTNNQKNLVIAASLLIAKIDKKQDVFKCLSVYFFLGKIKIKLNCVNLTFWSLE